METQVVQDMTGIETQTDFGGQGCSPETNPWLAVFEEAIRTDLADRPIQSLQSEDSRSVTAMDDLDIDADWVW